MVHALEQTHHLLKPGGWLINVNDLPVLHAVEVHTPKSLYRVGWLLDREDFYSTRSAFNALAKVVADEQFVFEDEQDFAYNIYVDGLIELQEWLSEWWSSALIQEKILRRLETLIQEGGQGSKIVMALRARMTKLRAA